LPRGIPWPENEFELGFMLYLMRKKLHPLTVPDISIFKALWMEGEGEIADHECGPDCICWIKDEGNITD
jgi:hypothetical protein